MKILVIAAHPDDEVLGCGGTIAKLAAQGEEVHILILATGLTSRPSFNLKKSPNALKIHLSRARRAGALLGAKNINFAEFPDQKMDTLPLLEITQRIESEIKSVRPQIIFTHHGGDLNMDHEIAFRATLTATRPKQKSKVYELYTYEVPSSTEYSFQKIRPVFEPNYFQDITKTVSKKLRAMKIYKSEIECNPHPRSIDALENLAKQRGSIVGVKAAEAFQLIRKIVP